MAVGVLSTLVDANAFVPSPLVDDLVACHVPFDLLVPNRKTEAALEDHGRRSGKTALVGPSGSGKSAVTAWVYDRVTTDFAPIRAPVFYEAEETVREPGPFARYLVQRLLDEARAVEALSENEREALLRQSSERLAHPTRTIGHSAGASLEVPWLLKGEAAREVSTTLGAVDLTGTTRAVLAAVDRAIDAIVAQGLTPMLVLDDTDRWLQVGNVDRRDLVGRFFGTIVRMLAERPCGLVVAVHETYLDLPEYVHGTKGFLSEALPVPRLDESSAVKEILAHRIRIQLEGVAPEDVFEGDAITRLFEYYASAGNRSLRWTLQTAHTAVAESLAVGASRVSREAVDSAAAR